MEKEPNVEIGCGDMDWVFVARIGNSGQYILNVMLMNLRVL